MPEQWEATPSEINGWIGRMREWAQVINTVLLAPLLVIYFLGRESGYIQNRPFDTMAEDVRAMRREMQTFALAAMKYERRDRLFECYTHFTDQKMREWCLHLGDEPPRP